MPLSQGAAAGGNRRSPPMRAATTLAAAPPGAGQPGRARPPPPEEDPDPATPSTPAVDVLARALGYPYPRPPSSFVFHAGTAHAFEDERWPSAGALASPTCVAALRLACPAAAAATAAAVAAGLTPVLAIGSNAGPAQLARKYGRASFPDTSIPATRGLLRGFDVVFAPLAASYGSITATLHPSPSPDTAVEVYVTWLGGAELERMHETEAAYDLMELRLEGRALALGTSVGAAAAGAPPAAWHPAGAPVLCYVHQHGSLLLDGSPAALAEIPALGRALPALDQLGAQAAVARLVGCPPGTAPEAFILENVAGDPAVRAGRVAALAAHAAPFSHPAARRLASLGSVLGRSVD